MGTGSDPYFPLAVNFSFRMDFMRAYINTKTRSRTHLHATRHPNRTTSTTPHSLVLLLIVLGSKIITIIIRGALVWFSFRRRRRRRWQLWIMVNTLKGTPPPSTSASVLTGWRSRRAIVERNRPRSGCLQTTADFSMSLRMRDAVCENGNLF